MQALVRDDYMDMISRTTTTRSNSLGMGHFRRNRDDRMTLPSLNQDDGTSSEGDLLPAARFLPANSMISITGYDATSLVLPPATRQTV